MTNRELMINHLARLSALCQDMKLSMRGDLFDRDARVESLEWAINKIVTEEEAKNDRD